MVAPAPCARRPRLNSDGTCVAMSTLSVGLIAIGPGQKPTPFAVAAGGTCVENLRDVKRDHLYTACMRLALTPHPDSQGTAVTRIDVDVSRPRAGTLVLHYFVTGALSEVRMPPMIAPARADGLWRHTCLEAFVRAPTGGQYYEFNFSPSLQWAAYRFTGYREGMSLASEMTAPQIEVQSGAALCTVRVSLDMDSASSLSGAAPWRVGLSAVIEGVSGGKSYWALQHPPGKADFHHSDCFAMELPAA